MSHGADAFQRLNHPGALTAFLAKQMKILQVFNDIFPGHKLITECREGIFLPLCRATQPARRIRAAQQPRIPDPSEKGGG